MKSYGSAAQGLKVVEVAMWVAGPSTTAVLGDWGADVIKLEDPRTGDPIRGFVTRTMGDPNARIRPPFELDNRNKRSVAVDLRTADGHAFALKLIERADVFVTSLRLDAIDRMKLDYATLSAKNPRLIYASINGYGHRGPDRNRPAYDYAAAWARSGLMATIAEPGQSPPAQRPAMIDHAVGPRPRGRDLRRPARARAHRPRPRGQHLAVLDGPLDERLGSHRRPDDGPLAAFRVAHGSRESALEFLSMRRRAMDLLCDDPERSPLAGFLPRARPIELARRSALQGLGRTRGKLRRTHRRDRSRRRHPQRRRMGADFRSPQPRLGARPHRRRSPRRSASRRHRRVRAPSIIPTSPDAASSTVPSNSATYLRNRIAPPPNSASIPRKSRSKSAFHGTKSPV